METRASKNSFGRPDRGGHAGRGAARRSRDDRVSWDAASMGRLAARSPGRTRRRSGSRERSSARARGRDRRVRQRAVRWSATSASMSHRGGRCAARGERRGHDDDAPRRLRPCASARGRDPVPGAGSAPRAASARAKSWHRARPGESRPVLLVYRPPSISASATAVSAWTRTSRTGTVPRAHRASRTRRRGLLSGRRSSRCSRSGARLPSSQAPPLDELSLCLAPVIVEGLLPVSESTRRRAAAALSSSSSTSSWR